MKILFVSNDSNAGYISYLLSQENNEVKLFFQKENRRVNFNGMVQQTTDWREDIGWVGKDGIIVFDDVGFGREQDMLRNQGYSVFGGSDFGDQLEEKRVFAQEWFNEIGMQSIESYDFYTPEEGVDFIRKNPGYWVIKQNGNSKKYINYVGEIEDGSDVVEVLNGYTYSNAHENEILTIQKRIFGTEIACTGFFDGKDWVGKTLINCEHKRFMSGDVGPATSEMGTLGWYQDMQDNKLFSETLEKLTSLLQTSNFNGIIDINCIVNENGAFPLEATSRTGSPTIHLQTELNQSSWTDVISRVCLKNNQDIFFNDGYGIVVVIAIPPFPYAEYMPEHNQIGTNIFFSPKVTDEDMKHIHFEEVSWHDEKKRHYISDASGYVLYVTGSGETVEEAQMKAYSLIKNIYIPKMMYRNDIGNKFIEKDYNRLKEWGYINS